MVILWPYLSFYFKNLGMDMEKLEDRKRAVHLLQYVVFLTGEAPEEDLALNKVLCGVPLEEPIPRSIQLTDQEKNLSEQLLRAVCKNWEKMENTSNMNLRVSFLQREGKLTEQDDGWYLKIEKQVLDLLLEKLSWGIGMIKLSWMDKLMHVEWI
ncbi:MAG: contractile injection system tape measure protein [Bacteroidota bacterium]